MQMHNLLQVQYILQITCSHVNTSFVTGFERTQLPHTQQEDTLFTITR